MPEFRSVPASEVRFDESKPRSFRARVLNYNVRDSYGTSWKPGVFARSLERDLPSLCWSHDWADPIGRATSYTDGPDGLDVEFEFDDFDAVPRAKQAYAQLKSGTMKQFSFAFMRSKEEKDPDIEDTTRICEAACDEFSMVLVGSVPGTRPLAIRSAGNLSSQIAASILTKFASGQYDLAEALTELKTSAGTGEEAPPVDPSKIEVEPGSVEDTPEPVTVPQPDPDESDVLSKLNLLSAGRSKRRS